MTKAIKVLLFTLGSSVLLNISAIVLWTKQKNLLSEYNRWSMEATELIIKQNMIIRQMEQQLEKHQNFQFPRDKIQSFSI